MLVWLFLIVVLAGIGKLIYDVQMKNKKENEANQLCKTEAEFEAKEQFQKLAGIGQPKNEIDPEIWKYIANKVSEEKFPEPDKSIPMTTATITTIGGSYGDSDPLASVPMSRVSKEAKQKMAEIAKDDINKQLEQNAEKFASIFPDSVEYTDEYHKPDYSKTKKKRNPKQTAPTGTDETAPFVKTRKKANKKS